MCGARACGRACVCVTACVAYIQNTRVCAMLITEETLKDTVQIPFLYNGFALQILLVELKDNFRPIQISRPNHPFVRSEHNVKIMGSVRRILFTSARAHPRVTYSIVTAITEIGLIQQI